MALRFLKYFSSFVIFLHCIGLTQLCSSYNKDKSIFVSMINMTEEETKKENDSKEDSESTKILKRKISLILTQNSGVSKANTSFWLCHTLPNQVFIENPTPPPDPMA